MTFALPDTVATNTLQEETITDEEEVFLSRKDMLSILDESEKIEISKLFRHASAHKYNSRRNNFFDQQSILDCCFEILLSKIHNGTMVIDWCHRIQNDISNQEIRDGWRVTFEVNKDGHHRYFYINDKRQEKKIISFNSASYTDAKRMRYR